MTVAPLPFQAEDLCRIHKEFEGRCIVGWEMGCGKTVVSLLYATEQELFPAIVICPKDLKNQWEQEAKKHVSLRADILRGMTPTDITLLEPAPLTIINYDIVGPWLPYLKRLKPKLLICDESHYLCNPRSKRTRFVRQLSRRIKHLLFLTGTAIMNKPIEIWATLNMLDKKEFPSYIEFGRRYCAPKRRFFGWDFSGASHLKELNQRLQKYMIRRRKEDVLTQLPPERMTVVPLDIIKRSEYERAMTDFLPWLAENFGANRARKAAKSEGLAQLGYLIRLVSRLKRRAVYRWLDDFLAGSDTKLMVFGVHHKMLDKLYARYQNTSVLVTGHTPDKERDLAKDKFEHDPATRFFLGNIQAAGKGRSYKGCSKLANVELAWRPGDHAQANARIRGIGRGEEGVPTDIYWLIAKNTIEEKMCAIIQRKQKVLSKTLDGGERIEDFDIYDELLAELAKERGLS